VPLGGKWRPPVRKVGEWYVESWHLQDCSLCLCRLRTDGLAPRVSIERINRMLVFMGPVSIVAYCRQMFDFLHCFIGWLGRETGYGLVDQSADALWIVSGVLFLRSSDSVQRCWWHVKGCYMWTTWDTYGPGLYVDWAWKACDMQSVHRFESPWLSDMSNSLFVIVIM
jgi:hypothetical protein